MPHRVVAPIAVDPAGAVEPEAISALVHAMEDRGRGVTGHWLTTPLQPSTILRALSLEGTPADTHTHTHTHTKLIKLTKLLPDLTNPTQPLCKICV